MCSSTFKSLRSSLRSAAALLRTSMWHQSSYFRSVSFCSILNFFFWNLLALLSDFVLKDRTGELLLKLSEELTLHPSILKLGFSMLLFSRYSCLLLPSPSSWISWMLGCSWSCLSSWKTGCNWARRACSTSPPWRKSQYASF